jgi:hypothetical protein
VCSQEKDTRTNWNFIVRFLIKKNSFLKKIENEEEIFNSLNDLDIVNSSRKTIGVSNFVIPIDEKAYILIGIIII